MIKLLVIVFSIIPVGLIMSLIYGFNKRQKQSPVMLGLLFMGGLLSFALVRLMSHFLDGRVFELSAESPFLSNDWEFFLVSFGMIAVVEELSKFIMLNFFSYNSPKYRYPYDGLVYGAFVSLGFAFAENIMYLYTQSLNLAVSRAIFTIPAHAAFGIIMGYYLSLAKACKIKKMDTDCLKMKYIAFFLPLVLHGTYNYICIFHGKWVYYILIIYTIFLYILAIYILNKMMQLDVEYYDQDKYKQEDIVMDYKDELAIQSEDTRKRLFETKQRGSFNKETKQYEVNNLDMKMFADDVDSKKDE